MIYYECKFVLMIENNVLLMHFLVQRTFLTIFTNYLYNCDPR